MTTVLMVVQEIVETHVTKVAMDVQQHVEMAVPPVRVVQVVLIVMAVVVVPPVQATAQVAKVVQIPVHPPVQVIVYQLVPPAPTPALVVPIPVLVPVKHIVRVDVKDLVKVVVPVVVVPPAQALVVDAPLVKVVQVH